MGENCANKLITYSIHNTVYILIFNSQSLIFVTDWGLNPESFYIFEFCHCFRVCEMQIGFHFRDCVFVAEFVFNPGSCYI